MINRNKIVAGFLGLIAVIFALVFLHSWFFTAKLLISVPSDAQIFVKQNGGDFERIGAGQASFKTRSLDTVFIEARRDSAVTQKSVTPQRRADIEVSLQVKALSSAEIVAPGPFINPLIEGQFIYGINANTNSLDAKPISGDENQLPPILPLLPFLKQIVWLDSENYIYVTAAKGAGVISASPGVRAEGLPYTNVVSANNSTVLLGNQGLHLAKGLNIKNAQLIAPAESGKLSSLYADSQFIYFVQTEFEEADHDHGITIFDRRPEIEEHDPGISNIIISVFNYDGNKIKDLSLNIQDRVAGIVSLGDSDLAILTTAGLRFMNIDTGDAIEAELSLGSINDMLLFNKRLLLLSETGLWEYNIESSEAYKTLSYPDGEEYVPNSLNIAEKSLYFSTAAKAETIKNTSANIQGKVYEVLLND